MPPQTPHWLLWMLSDSSLPTGGFVASSGLEASLHLSSITLEPSLLTFIHSSLHSLAHASTPYLKSAHASLAYPDAHLTLHRLDREYDALTGSNHVARRASIAQGNAYLTVLERGLAEGVEDESMKAVKLFKMKIRSGTSPGHLPITFGTICACLQIPLSQSLHLYLYLHARTLLSSAVRLNLVGPYRAQALLLHLQKSVDSVLMLLDVNDEEARTTAVGVDGRKSGVEETEEEEGGWQTAPLLDIMQGMHDKLYSRLFNS
ncbi:hypothetical protein HDV00_005091 [Rhizophlyctis rosea]|nr:hypothetical protein HDV00_005091 [Rhizophlyctis rosea]